MSIETVPNIFSKDHMRKTSNRVEDPEVKFGINWHAESAGLTGEVVRTTCSEQ